MLKSYNEPMALHPFRLLASDCQSCYIEYLSTAEYDAFLGDVYYIEAVSPWMFCNGAPQVSSITVNLEKIALV